MDSNKENLRHLKEKIIELENKVLQLNKSNYLYEKIIEKLPYGIQVFDKQGYSHKLNKKQKELLGLPNLEEGIGKFNVLTDPFSIAHKVNEIYQSIYDNGENFSHIYEYDFQVPNNKWQTRKDKRVFEEIIFPVKDDSDTVKYVVATLNDITNLRETEKKLEESEGRWKYAIEGNEDGLWDWNLITNKVFFSSQWKKMLGYSENEISNDLSEWDKRVHPDDKEQAYADIQKHLDGIESTYKNEHRMKCKDGKYIWILDRGKIVSYTDEGKPERMIGIHSNITERKKTEQAFKENKDKLEAFFSQSLTGFFFMMLDEPIEWNKRVDKEKLLDYVFKHQRITKTNQAILDQYKATEEEFIGLTPFDFYKNKIDYGKEIWEKFFDNGHLKIELKTRKFDGSEMYIEGDYICLYNDKGRITGHFGAQQEVTEKKKFEEKIQSQNEELKNSNATKDKFFSILAHDLRSPFSSILGFSELAIKDIENNNYNNLERYCNHIYQSTQQSYNLLDNLLQWSRIQTGKIEFNPENINVSDLLNNTIKLLSGNIESKKLKLVTKLNDDIKLTGDSFMMDTIIRNLISNAIKFTREEGKITLSVTTENEKVVISVKDTGVGMSQENQDNLFSLDNKYINTGTKNEKGTGLGLILCKDFVDRHNGKIEVKSKINRGTEFIVSIPAPG